MSFLSPLLLLLGGAAIVPLLLHLMRRRTGVRIEFPAARYLARAEKEHSRQLKLRNLLLMVLRVLAIACIALAAARPVSRLIPQGGTQAPAAIALVLDNSLSTSAIVGGRSVLDGLKDAAATAVGRLGASDRAWLVTADGSVQGGTPMSVRAALSRVKPLGGAGDPPAAVARAAALVGNAARATAGDAVVGVLTDGQTTTWGTTGAPLDAGAARVTVFVPSAPPPPNHAVSDVEARPLRWTPRGEIAVRFSGVADSSTYRIDLGSRTLARGTVSSDGFVSVHAAPPERGWVAGSVEIEPDELRADDIRHFAVWIGPPPAIAVDSGVGPFAAGALATLMSTGRATADKSGVAIVPADRLSSLPALIVAPSDPVRIGAANRALERAGVPWRFGAQRAGAPERVDGIVVGGDTARSDADVSVTQRYPLVAHGVAATDTLARAGNAPWIIAGRGYVLIASAIDPAATSFPVRASFVPWLDAVLSQRLGSASQGAVLHAVPGATVPRPDGADEMEAPDGAPRALVGTTIVLPQTPGVYFLRHAGARAGAIVSDGEPRESDLRRLGGAELTGRFKASGGARVYSDRFAWTDAVFAGNGTRSVLAPLLVLALIALAAESILARRWSQPERGAEGRRVAQRAA
jgi:aerotolerance regulator-like protein